MSEEAVYTLVVPDSELLAKVCGSNDSNLHFIEQHLGVSLFTHGNEISISTTSDEVLEKFRFVIDRIMDEAGEGEMPCPDMIKAILNQPDVELENKKQLFHVASIKIPGAVKTVYPKTQHQAEAVNSMRKKNLVFSVGPAGSGKTFLAVAEALAQVLSQPRKRLILTRPVVEAGENLGFLPGDLEQKINPYLRPLLDVMEYLLPRELLRKLTESAIIEIAPLAYMRGRTLSNCVVILDEAQNTTCEQMKMFLTRMGEGSKVFITGDITQIDLPGRKVSGLVQALDVLSDIDDIAVHYLDAQDVVRAPLVKKIIQAYENAKTK